MGLSSAPDNSSRLAPTLNTQEFAFNCAKCVMAPSPSLPHQHHGKASAPSVDGALTTHTFALTIKRQLEASNRNKFLTSTILLPLRSLSDTCFFCEIRQKSNCHTYGIKSPRRFLLQPLVLTGTYQDSRLSHH